MKIVSQEDVAELKAILAHDAELLGEECHAFMAAVLHTHEYFTEVIESGDEEAFEFIRAQAEKMDPSKLLLFVPRNSSLAPADD